MALHVDRLLVEEFQARVAREPGFLKDYRAVITTFFHIHEVKQALPQGAPPAVALLSEANISSLLRLTELPEGTTVGLVCNSREGQREPSELDPVGGAGAPGADARVGRRSLVHRSHAGEDAHHRVLGAGRGSHPRAGARSMWR